MSRLNYSKGGRRVPTVEVPADLLVALFRFARSGMPQGVSGDLLAIAATLERRATRKLAEFNRSEPK